MKDDYDDLRDDEVTPAAGEMTYPEALQIFRKHMADSEPYDYSCVSVTLDLGCGRITGEHEMLSTAYDFDFDDDDAKRLTQAICAILQHVSGISPD